VFVSSEPAASVSLRAWRRKMRPGCRYH